MSKQLCVSVIVPFYNAESYIKTCLDVLLNQDFTKPFEIIMVDDASTDNTSQIIHDLSANEGTIEVISHDLNLGKGAALR